MELTEELESLTAIFGRDVSYSVGRDGQMLVNILMKKKIMATLKLPGNYPNSPPEVQLSLQYSFPELEQCINDVSKDSIGAPMLFQMIEATREWLQNHPNDGGRGSRDVSPIRSSDATVCKFFKQGKCKFGDKCKLLHPTKGHSPAMAEGAMATIESKQKQTGSKVDEKNGKTKPTTTTTQEGEESEKKSSMRSATDVISRILWDGDLPTEQFCIGYLDRFVGIIEKPFAAFSWEDIASVGPSVLSIPKHRIQYFKYRDQIVWDKRSQMDNFFGSRGGSTIDEIVQAMAPTTEAGDQKQPAQNLELSPNKKHYDDKDRPTHFLCIQICDQEVVANIRIVQDHILTVSPQLSEGLVSPTAFHITLCMVRLENDYQISKAKAALEKMKPHFLLMLPRNVHLLLNGVDNFKDRLVYVKVAPNAALSKLVYLLIERLQAAGVKTPGNHSEYTPHVTIVKMSRPMQKELSVRIAGQALYSKFQNNIMGRQQLQTIDLCSLTGPKQEDGFFPRLHTISNSLVHLTPDLRPSLLCAVEALSTHGKLSEREKATIVNVVSSSSTDLPDERKFERALKLLTNTRLTSSQETAVVILRGVPGSGKSFLATNSSEYLSNPSEFAVCSADEYFIKDGTYTFVPELVPEAHAYCLQKFLKCVSNIEFKFVIVDNTNSQVWEYQIYTYLCEILHLDMHIVEIPCPTDFIAGKFQSRNAHNIDSTAVKNTVQRWENDDKAVRVSPRLSYPTGSTSRPDFSLEWIVQLGKYQSQLLDSFSAHFAVYTGIFLTTESQWLLVSTYPPAFANVHADHVTLCYKPSTESITATKIGQKVKIRVTGHESSSGVQAVRVQVPSEVQCNADIPHITISTDNGVAPKMATAMLSKTQVSTKQQNSIVLEGTVGIVVHELFETDKLSDTEANKGSVISESDLAKLQITSKKMFQQKVAKKLYPTLAVAEETEVSIHNGTSDITDLFLFDFDGTLFHTPYPEEGKALYKQQTGENWPHKGWWGCPQSLLPPLVIYPGPAIGDFRSHLGLPGSKTFILTSRIDKARGPLKKIIEHASIFPERVLMKPSDLRVSGDVFKGIAIKELLSQLPNLTRIKFWDDKEENLKEVERVAKLTKPGIQVELLLMEKPLSLDPDYLEELVLKSKPPNSRLETNLTTYCHLPSATYTQAAQVGVHFLAQQFSQIIEFQDDPNLLAYPFGSFPLGRSSDVDLCLLAPPTNTPMEFADKLAAQLELCGIKFIHVGRSSRCPRLKVRISFNEIGPIDYDIVFAIVKEEAILHSLENLTVLELQSMLKPGDAASKTAFTGPVFLHHVKEALQGVISSSIFAAVVEMTVQILRASHLKGNAYHCIRTFHIIQLLADFIKSRTKVSPSSEWNADTLFKVFVNSCSQLPVPKWKKLFGDFVPSQYIDKIISLFVKVCGHVESSDFPSSETYYTLRTRVPIPQPSYTAVSIQVSSSNEVLLWKAASVIEAKLPTYIRKLLDSGIDVIPCPTTNDERTCTFCFAVPEGNNNKEAIQQVLRPFWGEISEYRQNNGMSINLLFELLEEYKLDEEMVATAASHKYTDLVMKFCSGKERELHLSPNLSAYERRLVHEAAERMGVSHKTADKDGKAHIVLQKTGTN